ncbi:MAG: hypothetical protein KIT62_03005 [Cyclobacteriaceae bacterium]|nr:hypothetical protein [Cyclobacteriaceae bacterium]
MKKTLLLLALVAILASCTFETYQCPAYSQVNKITKQGEKAQAKYGKRKI